ASVSGCCLRRTSTPARSTLSLHDALPIYRVHVIRRDSAMVIDLARNYSRYERLSIASGDQVLVARRSDSNFLRDVLYPLASLTADRKSTRLNSSHRTTSYAVFCLKKKLHS